MRTSINTLTPGAPKPLRTALADKYRGHVSDWSTTRTRRSLSVCGATEGMIASLMAVTNPGDEVVVFEPFYENYRPMPFSAEP